MKLSTLFLSAILVSSFATASQAQSLHAKEAMTLSQTQTANVRTSLQFKATNAPTVFASLDAVKQLTRSIFRDQISEGLASVTAAEIGNHLNGSFERLTAGQSISFGKPVMGSSQTALSLRSLSVKVNYDPRPIGGILNVRVSLFPVFCGIGSASRPVEVREVAMAVESLDKDAVSEIVATLSHELASQLTSH